VSPENMADHWWWRPGWKPGRRMYTWHITFDDQPTIQDLAARYQAKLSGLTGLDLIPARWLHLTTQGLGFTDEVSDTDVDAVVDRARQRLAKVDPVQATLGPATVTPEAILLDVAPLSELRRIRDELRASITDVWGPDRLMEGDDWTPHVSVAYSNSTAPAAPYLAAMENGDTASVPISHVQLIVLDRDQRMYEWTTRADIPLGR
jgi:2'-5' RNA ligase